MQAPSKVQDLLEPVLLQKRGDLLAAHAMVANHHGFLVGIQFSQAGWEFPHRDVAAALEVAKVKFMGLAYVEKERGGGVLQALP